MSELISIIEARALMPTYIERARKLEENIKRANKLIRVQASKDEHCVYMVVDTAQEAKDICAALEEKLFKCSYKESHVFESDPLGLKYGVTILW